MTEISFHLAGAGAVFFALLMLFQRSLYAAAACLLASLLQTAVLLYLAGSPLVGFLQVVICAGGVMALVVVAIVSASRPGAGPGSAAVWSRFAGSRPLAVGVLLLTAVELVLVCAGSRVPGLAGTRGALDARLGAVLFGPYALATEAVAVLLFLAALALTQAGEAGEEG